MLPYWESDITQDLAAGKTVLVTAHGNSLRALVKHLDGISDDDIAGLNIPTGIPLVYKLDDDFASDRALALPRPRGRRRRCRRGRRPGQEVVPPRHDDARPAVRRGVRRPGQRGRPALRRSGPRSPARARRRRRASWCRRDDGQQSGRTEPRRRARPRTRGRPPGRGGPRGARHEPGSTGRAPLPAVSTSTVAPRPRRRAVTRRRRARPPGRRGHATAARRRRATTPFRPPRATPRRLSIAMPPSGRDSIIGPTTSGERLLDPVLRQERAAEHLGECRRRWCSCPTRACR